MGIGFGTHKTSGIPTIEESKEEDLLEDEVTTME